MLKLRPHLISSTHLLFPTISNMRCSPNGRRLALLFSSAIRAPTALLISALSWAPTRILQPLVGLLSNQRGAAAGVTTGLVQSPGTVVAALTMAAEEMDVIDKLDARCLEEHGGKMRFYWAKEGDDGWVAEKSVVEIERVLVAAGWSNGRRRRCEEGMVHAFVLTDREFFFPALESGRELIHFSCTT